MKRMLPCLLVLVLAMPGRSDEKESEAKVQALVDSSAKVVELMKSIKDGVGAEKHKGTLEKALADWKKAEEEMRKLPPEDLKKLQKTFEPKFAGIRGEFKKEGERLLQVAGVMAVLGDLGPFKQAREAKLAVTRQRLVGLDKALESYKLTTGDFPKSLRVLTQSPGEGIPAALPAAALIDPWGRPFQYDVKGPKNKGTKPDVWSLGPPVQKDTPLGNWEKK